ncbi:uncharacterized protein LOC142227506 [Haematobia irritans]|uniref:uncharacterized protein LOC142227506 n=1 Tax=Haematobia irritans TaxID=7368 RepID=UPI003F4FC235
MKSMMIFSIMAMAMSGIMAVSVLEVDGSSKSEESLWPQESGTEILNDQKVKINWLPVWDDIEGSNEFVVKDLGEKEICSPRKNRGLLNLIRESMKLLPMEGIKSIIHSYANDPEVKALNDFVTSSEYEKKVSEIRHSEEYRILKSYACHVLHIDLQDFHTISRKSVRSGQESKGIRGLMQKIHSILPHQKLVNLYQDLMKIDNDLVEAVAHLKSEEFQQIVLNLRNNVPAYREVQERLMALGVPMKEMRDVINSILGWNDDLDVLI